MRQALRFTAIVLVSAGLLGCATAAQQQVQVMRNNFQTAFAQAQSCTRAVYESPEAEVTHAHLPYNINDASLQQLSESAFISDDEAQAILGFHPTLQTCRKTFLDTISTTHSGMVPIFAMMWQKSEASLIELIQKKQNWGQHLVRVKQNVAEAQAELVREDQRIMAGMNQAHQNEVAQRQAAANAFAQYLQTQQVINAMNRPVVTNCNRFGASVNCISQ